MIDDGLIARNDRLDRGDASAAAFVPARGCNPAIKSEVPGGIIQDRFSGCNRVKPSRFDAVNIDDRRHSRNALRSKQSVRNFPAIGRARRSDERYGHLLRIGVPREEALQLGQGRPRARTVRMREDQESRAIRRPNELRVGGPNARWN
jgi:hypothetical protein